MIDAWFGGLEPMVSEMMAGAGWGWHIETALHVLRMILGGVFDAHPELQIVVGHMGETLPFMLQRVDVMAPAMTKLKKPISVYLRENVHYTFSGFNFLPTFLELLLQVGVDRIMFSTDHPYQSMAEGRAFLDRAASQRRRSGANCAWQCGTAVWRFSRRSSSSALQPVDDGVDRFDIGLRVAGGLRRDDRILDIALGFAGQRPVHGRVVGDGPAAT